MKRRGGSLPWLAASSLTFVAPFFGKYGIAAYLPACTLASPFLSFLFLGRRGLQVYIDVLESVNLLMSSNGAVLRNDVSGKVIMKTLLSGALLEQIGANGILPYHRGSAAQVSL